MKLIQSTVSAHSSQSPWVRSMGGETDDSMCGAACHNVFFHTTTERHQTQTALLNVMFDGHSVTLQHTMEKE